MTRQLKRRICERCGEEFQVANNRKVVLCRKCAEYLRSQGQGPRQLQRQHNNREAENVIQPGVQELDWSKDKQHLLYYLNRFRRFPVYDGISPEKVDDITDGDRRQANRVAARMGGESVGSSGRQVYQRNRAVGFASYDRLRLE